ncbi:hypothetical protein JB92DRAFT_2798348 [Gautieria morchelliformis]|nr:hypothetical protein JB92DRAFT_2798348 [Gautieria morchelliformis]
MLDFVRAFLSSSTPWEQILPLLFVFGFAPLLALGTYYKYNARRTLPWLAAMFLENLGLGFAWSWLYDHDSPASSSRERERKPARKKHHLRRADHAAARAENTHEGENERYYYYPGVVNISGTYCFLNSTLQAMASLCYLQPYLDAVHSRAVRLDVPTPVVDALRDALSDLNTPTPRPRVLRPVSVINALSGPVPGKQRSALFASREHQDAQELFQLVSEAVKNEARAVDDELSRDRGLGELSRAPSEELDAGATMTAVGRDKDAAAAVAKGVFDGLTANRRSCVECGYTEAVMHFAFDNWQLAVPRMASCRLEDCLTDYTRLELLNDCICRKCSMLATHKRLVAEAEKATEAASASGEHGVSSSKKKRAREARKLEARVKAALDDGRIEEDIKGVKMEKVFSRCSTKQAMIARPPLVLALHLNRSIHYGTSGVKNTCRIIFPELLDLTAFTTSGQLSTSPSAPISAPAAAPPPRSNTPTPATYAPRVLYRLAAVVCHYGGHSFGHYVAYRRKPRPPAAGTRRFAPPTVRCPLGCECARCVALGPIRDGDEDGGGSAAELAVGEMPAYAASRWLRISDENVEEVGIERVLAESAGTFMLYYERVVQPRPALWPVQSSPRSSEETIKPVGAKLGDGDAAVGVGVGSLVEALQQHPRGGARILRSVHAGRSRSPSVRDLSPASSLLDSLASSSSVREEQEPEPEPERTTPTPTPTLELLPTGLVAAAVPNGDVVHSDPDVQSHLPDDVSISKPQPPVKPDMQPATTPLSHSRSAQHLRSASPQPTHAHRPPSPSLARTVGLRA